jgi:hypothetical protein
MGSDNALRYPEIFKSAVGKKVEWVNKSFMWFGWGERPVFSLIGLVLSNWYPDFLSLVLKAFRRWKKLEALLQMALPYQNQALRKRRMLSQQVKGRRAVLNWIAILMYIYSATGAATLTLGNPVPVSLFMKMESLSLDITACIIQWAQIILLSLVRFLRQ